MCHNKFQSQRVRARRNAVPTSTRRRRKATEGAEHTPCVVRVPAAVARRPALCPCAWNNQKVVTRRAE